MANVFNRVYRTFEDFERSELRKLDHLYDSVDDLIDEMMLAEMEDEAGEHEDGILFDEIGDVEKDD